MTEPTRAALTTNPNIANKLMSWFLTKQLPFSYRFDAPATNRITFSYAVDPSTLPRGDWQLEAAEGSES